MRPRPDHGETSYRGSGRLAGRKALITGGDSEIGRAAAIAYAREGADVAINYLPFEEPDAREVVQLIRAAGRRAVAIPGDIRSERFCGQLVDRAARELGGSTSWSVMLLSSRRASQSTRSQPNSSTRRSRPTCKAALRHMGPGSAIIITSSQEAFQPSPILLDYGQAKAAQVAFAKSLAKQLAKRGIRVNAVAPGFFWTPLQPSGGQPLEKIPRARRQLAA